MKAFGKIFLVSILMLAISRISANAVQTISPSNAPTTLGNLSSLIVEGNSNVILQQAKPTSAKNTPIPSSEYHDVKLGSDDTVVVGKPHWWEWWFTAEKTVQNSNPTVVTVSDLKTLIVHDHAIVTGNHLKFSHLTVLDNSNGNVELNGEIGLDELVVLGKGNINMQWVFGHHLVLTGYGTGSITLAGMIDRAWINLGNTQKLNAQYLRVPVLNIHTQNKAVGNVLSTNELNAFVYDGSTVYYFQWPHSDNEITNFHGNVLQGGWYN